MWTAYHVRHTSLTRLGRVFSPQIHAGLGVLTVSLHLSLDFGDMYSIESARGQGLYAVCEAWLMRV